MKTIVVTDTHKAMGKRRSYTESAIALAINELLIDGCFASVGDTFFTIHDKQSENLRHAGPINKLLVRQTVFIPKELCK